MIKGTPTADNGGLHARSAALVPRNPDGGPDAGTAPPVPVAVA